MSEGFSSPIAAGDDLVIPALQSPNYVAGVSGWAVFRNGNVEFNSGTFRGTVTAGTFQGNDFIITATGAFWYSGAPAAGNLLASVVPGTSPVADPEGNAALPGITSYEASNFTATSLGAQGVFCYAAASQAGPYGAAYAFLSFDTSGELFLSTALGGIQLSSVSGILVNAGALGITLDGPVTATGGTAASPTVVTTDTWHAAAPANGWANQGGGLYELQYRLMPDNSVWLIGVISSAALTSTQFFTLPAGYRPANTGGDYPVGFHTSAGYTAGCFLRIATSGACSVVNAVAGTGAVLINARIPLDNI